MSRAVRTSRFGRPCGENARSIRPTDKYPVFPPESDRVYGKSCTSNKRPPCGKRLASVGARDWPAKCVGGFSPGTFSEAKTGRQRWTKRTTLSHRREACGRRRLRNETPRFEKHQRRPFHSRTSPITYRYRGNRIFGRRHNVRRSR